jgi:predicted RNase H-like HicB family nuclease
LSRPPQIKLDRASSSKFDKIFLNIKERTAMKLQVILEPSDEGGYTVFVPSLPGCISEGEDVNEALVNIQEAIALYLEPVEKDINLTEMG